MVVIEDKGQLKFFEGKNELTLWEGFSRLEQLYMNEPQEVKRVINKLREKYKKKKRWVKPSFCFPHRLSSFFVIHYVVYENEPVFIKNLLYCSLSDMDTLNVSSTTPELLTATFLMPLPIIIPDTVE